jgi:acyl-CoA-binding protein
MSKDFKKYNKYLKKINKDTERFIILNALYKRITIGKCNIEKPLPKIKKNNRFCSCFFPGNIVINFNDVLIYEYWKELNNVNEDYAKELFLKLLKSKDLNII